jgi:hypothetical protein
MIHIISKAFVHQRYFFIHDSDLMVMMMAMMIAAAAACVWVCVPDLCPWHPSF